MIDVTHQVNSVRRQVGTRTLEAGEARIVTVSQTYDSTVEDVWDACTNPERIQRWFLPVSGDLRPGGRYQLEGNAGGTIERCDPPKSFFATWEYGEGMSWIEVRLAPEHDGKTRLELDHIARIEDGEEFWNQFGPGAVGVGWDQAVMGLAIHLSTGESLDAREFQDWILSEEGRRFVALSSEAWRDASIAAGTERAAAQAAADRTTAFYTTPPEV